MFTMITTECEIACMSQREGREIQKENKANL